MKILATEIPGLLLLEPTVFEDERGFFFESFHQQHFDEALGHAVRFVQDNHSGSQRGVLRGLHYQSEPHAQGKLVRVLAGRIFDAVVDLRRDSPHFGKWFGTELSAANRYQLWVPPGFAHGFVALDDNTEVAYKVTTFWQPGAEKSIRWDDPDLAIAWPIETPILSQKDAQGLRFRDMD
ncbi:MAG TPA: dTDP-4-dehydrorhamnose 3,5-epimerase [Chitinolyticbacter sp.]|nr:dTDP-4-dehydrorhamnose 3,5-epimerase [Chitinolyticbacter sp.]